MLEIVLNLYPQKNLKVQKGTISSEVKIMGPKIIFKMNPKIKCFKWLFLVSIQIH